MVLHITPTRYFALCWGVPIFLVYTRNILAPLQDVELDVLTTDSAGLRVVDRLATGNLVRFAVGAVVRGGVANQSIQNY